MAINFWLRQNIPLVRYLELARGRTQVCAARPGPARRVALSFDERLFLRADFFAFECVLVVEFGARSGRSSSPSQLDDFPNEPLGEGGGAAGWLVWLVLWCGNAEARNNPTTTETTFSLS